MIRINLKFIIFLFVVLFISSIAFADDNFDESLSKARKLVEEKSYTAALEAYSQISEGLHRDPGLVIEWARVYTYADKHMEAIKLFEQIRAMYPQRSAEIIRELADQYKWSSQVPKAIDVYNEGLVLKVKDLQIFLGLAEALFMSNQKSKSLQIYDAALVRWPDNLDALLGKANVLSFSDKLEESFTLYQKVLDKDPGNLTALNSQARVLVWQGYYRKGISRYKQILKHYPKNPDAIEGIAFGLHWLGDDAGAVDRIKELFEFEPNRKEAQDLYAQIKNSRFLFVRPYGRFTNDSTPQTVTTEGLRSGSHPNYSTTIDGIYEHQILRKKGSLAPTIGANRGGVGLGKTFGDTYEFHSFLYGTHFTKVDFNPLTTNTWFTFKPDDYWRFDLAYDRETFDDNDAAVNKIITNSPSISVDFRPNRYWLFSAKYKRSYFSDDNLQNQAFGKIEYRLSQKPYVKLFYNYYYSVWAQPDLYHGYFDPRSISSHALGLYTGVDLTKKLFIETKASGGYEFQRKPNAQAEESNHPTCYLAASLNYRLADNWLLSTSGDFFTTWPDHGQRSYQKRGVYLSITYNFGVNPGTLRDATRPYRVTGG